jgi:predicted nucleic acid-binding protein
VSFFHPTRLIVAATIEPGCDRLYGEGLQHGRRFGDCVVVNPFLEDGW